METAKKHRYSKINKMNCRKRNDSFEDDESDIESEDGAEKRPFWCGCAIIASIVIFSIALFLFLLAFVVFPLVFMNVIAVERFFVFLNIDSPAYPEFDNPEKYGITGVANCYHTTNDTEEGGLVSIGMWQILPEFMKNSTNRNCTTLLQEAKAPILLYLHGVACNRAQPTVTYEILRKRFHIVAIDHRGFGDSTSATLSENGVMNDNIQIYQWLLTKTKREIYIWGHSLGTALSTRAFRALTEMKIKPLPMGLVLESPFTTLREEVPENAIGKIFAWLAYFNATILDPLDWNELKFLTSENILKVDVPIMIMHARDDNVIPYRLGEKLYKMTSERRLPHQGNVTFHEFGKLGYKHIGITTDPHMDEYIEEFINICRAYKNSSRGWQH